MPRRLPADRDERRKPSAKLTVQAAAPFSVAARTSSAYFKGSRDKVGFMTTSDPRIVSLVGSLALSRQGRLGKDMTLAPNMKQKVALAAMSAGAYGMFHKIESISGIDDSQMAQLMEPTISIVDDLEARLRPGDWWERLVKSFILIGVLSDLSVEISRLHAPELLREIGAENYDGGHGEWAAAIVRQAAQADPQLESRLSLWGRRVVGEALGVARQVAKIYDEQLDLDIASAAGLHPLLARHGQRMAKAGLKA